MNDSLSKITSMIESAKDLSIEAAMSASSKLMDSTTSRPHEISNLLNSRSNRDILNGMRCVISIISKEEDGLPYFADVVKNITNESSKVRQLVMIYLTKYADAEADTALLSINSIQKSLNDKIPANRANAIRSLAGIKIGSIVPILTLSLKRTSTDPSPLVRASAALSIGKIYDIAGKSRKQIYEILGNLLADSDVIVVAAAIKTFYRIKNKLKNPKKWQYIHGNFRRFCSLITKFDEWTQVFIMEILTEYCRTFIKRPTNEEEIDPDLNLFITSLQPLVQSISDIVIISVAKSIYLLAPTYFQEYHLEIMLLRIATTSSDQEIALFALQSILLVCKYDPKFYAKKFKQFYLTPDEFIQVSLLKLNILALIANEENFKYILEELKYYALYSKNTLVSKESINAMAKCSTISSEWSQKILNWCLTKLEKLKGNLMSEILTVIRYIIQQKYDLNGESEKFYIVKILKKLAAILDNKDLDLEDNARASIIWTIGEYTILADNLIGPDVLRVSIKNFAQEPESVRYQLLVLACKIATYELNKIENDHSEEDRDTVNLKVQESIEFKMFQHVLHLCKYDNSYDTRDRSRMFNVLLNSGSDRSQLSSLIFQAPKPIPSVEINGDELNNKSITKYFKIVDWTKNQKDLPSSSIRDETPIQYNKLSSSSNAFNKKSPSPISFNENSFSSKQVNELPNLIKSKNLVTQSATKASSYKLQSLDEFFGSEEEESSEEEEEEEESSEEEEEEEESNDEDEQELEAGSKESEEEEGSEEEGNQQNKLSLDKNI
ncbi:APL6 [Candida jiufengensis]|uniref:APL6 n=1 Tax=Candida jiufengensis TaxID=497108 RepID=UPI00222518EF|nr:APL6 [Candida jiufengensis]KAI5955246.1 APL6 [Candida jiufengensis]